jgi:prepilin-type N-terminal cleavage/methylation domain-containing protein
MKETRRQNAKRGMSLLELMIAMAILAVGLAAISVLFCNALLATNRNFRDTSGTFLAKMVLESISAQHPDSNQPIAMTDCQGTAWNITPTGGAFPGLGARLNTATGNLDQTQALSTLVASGYGMQFADCGTSGNGAPVIYDVRWNVTTITANQTRMVTVTARVLNSSGNQLGGRIFAMPVTLRGIAGP